MPHKRTRKRANDSEFDLPPTSFAKPLPVGKAPQKPNGPSSRRNKERANGGAKVRAADDTPRAFKQILQAQQARGVKRNALSNQDEDRHTPDGRSKKRKIENGRVVSQKPSSRTPTISRKDLKPAPELPKIQPGEKMSDFSARVNMALPLTGISRKSAVNNMSKKERERLMGGERRTKLEKKMQRMQALWRLEESRRKEKEEDERELADQADAANEWEGSRVLENGGVDDARHKTGKKVRRKGQDEDPWKVLEQKRDKPRGLHDVVQAPPDFRKIGRGKFKVQNGAKVIVDNVPAMAGSLRKREELGEARKDIINRYREMMEERRAARM